MSRPKPNMVMNLYPHAIGIGNNYYIINTSVFRYVKTSGKMRKLKPNKYGANKKDHVIVCKTDENELTRVYIKYKGNNINVSTTVLPKHKLNG